MAITRTIREQVTSQIRDQLVAGEFDGGQVLRETELATRFGVSRGPIRDAFLQLSQEGFLAYQANCGVTVRHPPDPAHREFICSLRSQIEIFSITNGLADLTDEALEKVESALEGLKAACASKDVAAVARCDMNFHESILFGCTGEEFLNAWRQLSARMLLIYTRLDDYGDVYKEHAAIMEPLRSRDVKSTAKALKNNIL